MKKILFVLVFFTVVSGVSQTFNKYDSNNQVTSLVISKKMLEMLSLIEVEDTEMQNFVKVARNISEIRMYTTSNTKVQEQIQIDVNNHIKLNHLKNLIQTDKEKVSARVYVKETSTPETFSQLLVVVKENEQQIILLVTGQVSLNDLDTLIKKMNLPFEIVQI